MNFKMIEALLKSTQGFTGTIDTDFLHLKGAKNSTDHFYDELEKVGITARDMPESMDDALVNLENEYERQGFISGFRMGVKLMIECIGPAPLEAWDPNDLGNPVSRVK